jgi:hypothetical protein
MGKELWSVRKKIQRGEIRKEVEESMTKTQFENAADECKTAAQPGSALALDELSG